MKRVLATSLCAIALAGCTTWPMLDSDDPADEIRRFYVEQVGDPACSVAIVRGGRASFAGDPHAIYRIGSLTKLFVAEALVRLAARGAIDLDAPVTRYSKYALSEEYGSVTLRDLMLHRSGMPMDFLNPWNPLAWHRALMCGLTGSHIYAEFDAREGFAEACNFARTRRFLAAREPQYSNVGFALLAAAAEDATGKDIGAIVREEVTGPLGLRDTAFTLSAVQAARCPRPSAGKLPWLAGRGRPVEAHPLGPALLGMGGLWSSAADCATFFSKTGLAGDDGLRARKLKSGRTIDYRFGMIYGGEAFLCRDQATGGMLLILRNVTSWPSAEDFEMADRLFSRDEEK
ncbi:MAG: beta-lactamase family protein [Kiritimatiellae bacterium]|nr:beta-lactamase family protein [Kiritimatiellia bacterium]